MQHGNSRLLAALHALRNHPRALFRPLQTSDHACRNLRSALRPPGLRRRSRGESELACPVRLAAGLTLNSKCRGALRAALPPAPGPLPAATLAPACRPTPPHAPPSRCLPAGLPLEALEEPLPGPARRHFRAYWRLQQRVCAGELQPGGVRGRVPPGRSSPADPWPTLVPAVLARPPRSHPAVPGWPGVQPLGPVLRVVSAVRACWEPQLHVCVSALAAAAVESEGRSCRAAGS